ncbi:MAG: creatininase family protein [Longimicrobiales bacterium]
MSPPKSLALWELSWPQVELALDQGFRRVIFALGATEQHGPHLPLTVDTAIGTDLCLRVAHELGQTLVAPTVHVGCSEHHMHFPGTLSVRAETLEAVVTDYVTSLTRHGFTEILIVPSHGGNFRPLEDMLPRLVATAKEGVAERSARVQAFTELVTLMTTWRQAIDDAGGKASNVGGHADIAESSIMLTLTPHLVDEHAAEKGYMGDITDEALGRIIQDGLQSVTANGILGDARGMSADLGAACQSAVATVIADSFRDAQSDTPQ